MNDRRLAGAETVANLAAADGNPRVPEVGLRLNPEQRRIPADMQTELSEAGVALSDWGGGFDEVMRNPSRYGIENTSDRCAGRATAVHKVVGNKFFEEIAGTAGQEGQADHRR